VVKLFQGEGFQEFVEAMRTRFASVRMRKPSASRSGNRGDLSGSQKLSVVVGSKQSVRQIFALLNFRSRGQIPC